MPYAIGVITAVGQRLADGHLRGDRVRIAAEGSEASAQADLTIGGPAGMLLKRIPIGTNIYPNNVTRLEVARFERGMAICAILRGAGTHIVPRMGVALRY